MRAVTVTFWTVLGRLQRRNPSKLVNGKIYNVYTMMRSYDITTGHYRPRFIHCLRSEDEEKYCQ